MHRCSHSTTTMTPRGSRMLHQRVGDLRGQPLLHLRPTGEDVDQPGQLGQPGDAAVVDGDVADVRDAVERHQVVLAHRADLDVLDQHHLVVAEVERRGQDVLRLLPQAGEDLARRPGDPAGRLRRPVAVRVLADGDRAARGPPPRRAPGRTAARRRPRHAGRRRRPDVRRPADAVGSATPGQPRGPSGRSGSRRRAAARRHVGGPVSPMRCSLACAVRQASSLGGHGRAGRDARLAEPATPGAAARLRTCAKISATSALSSVSFSSSSRTRSSRTSRLSTRIS